MIIDFYVEENRVDECKKFIRTLSSTRFNQNPIKVGNKYNINITLTSDDNDKLNTLFDKWYQEDNKKETPRNNIFKRIFNIICR
jgi:hypothetical protein